MARGETSVKCHINQCETSQIVQIRDKLLKKENPLRLESGEPFFDTNNDIIHAASKALFDGKTHYVNSQGIPELRDEICRKLNVENGFYTRLEEVIVTNGGMHGLYVTLSALLDAGDEVLIPTPNWTCVHWLITMIGAKPVPFNLKKEDGTWGFSYSEMKDKLTSNTKAILVNSPHNPTGHVMTEQDRYSVESLVNHYDLKLISDEAYEHIRYDNKTFETFNVESKNLISIFTNSKSYAMTGWRLGYVVIRDKELMGRVKKAVLYTSNGIATATQYGGIKALQQGFNPDHLEYYESNRDILVDAISRSSTLQLKEVPQGAFYLFPEIVGSADDFEYAMGLVNDYKLGAVPGSAFGEGGKGHIRLSYACHEDMIHQAAEIIKQL